MPINRGEFVCRFVELLTFGSGQWIGKRFALQTWQREVLTGFYGDIEDDGTRRRQYLYLEIPKKNGKTELAAALGLYHLLADGEENPQVYICAADRENASICFNAIQKMVEAAPWLSVRCKLVASQKRLMLRDGSGFIKVLSSEAFSKHGLNVSCVIFDELHAQPNRDLWDVMTFGAGDSRRQPVWIVLTTAGDDPDRKSIGWEVHDRCRRILAARSGIGSAADDDPAWYPVIYGMPDDPEELSKIDIYDEEVWRRCNPSIGVTVPLKVVRQEALAARQSEAKERLFRWLRLNQWIATKAVGWIPLTIYDKTQWNPEGCDHWRDAVEKLAGLRCYGGLDLSSTTDLTAFTLLFPPQDWLKHWVALSTAWTCQDNIEAREKRDHVPYRDWERAGFITICPGNIIDYSEVLSTIYRCAEIYDIAMIGVDPYMSRTVSQQLMSWEATDPESATQSLTVVEIPQTIAHLSPPMKEMERMIRNHEMLHVHNTCLRWNFGNVRCFVDGNENMKPMKNRSTGRIDMVVSWIISMAAAQIDMAATDKLVEAVDEGTFSF